MPDAKSSQATNTHENATKQSKNPKRRKGEEEEDAPEISVKKSKNERKDKTRNRKDRPKSPPMIDPTVPRLFNWEDDLKPSRGIKRKAEEGAADESVRRKSKKMKNSTSSSPSEDTKEKSRKKAKTGTA